MLTIIDLNFDFRVLADLLFSVSRETGEMPTVGLLLMVIVE